MDSPSQLYVPTSKEASSSWTDEKHLHFLKTMEASFVRAMLGNDSRPRRRLTHNNPLRLDRYLPDTSECTLDSKPQRTTRKYHTPSPSADLTGARTRIEGRRRRRRSSQPYNSSQDQVVPQLENERKESADHVGDDKD